MKSLIKRLARAMYLWAGGSDGELSPSKPRAEEVSHLGTSGLLVGTGSRDTATNIKILIRLMGFTRMLISIEQDQGLTEGPSQAIIDARSNFYRRMENLIAEHFSDEEVGGLVQFYSSPLGAAFAKHQVESAKKFADIVQKFCHDVVGGA